MPAVAAVAVAVVVAAAGGSPHFMQVVQNPARKLPLKRHPVALLGAEPNAAPSIVATVCGAATSARGNNRAPPEALHGDLGGRVEVGLEGDEEVDGGGEVEV